MLSGNDKWEDDQYQQNSCMCEDFVKYNVRILGFVFILLWDTKKLADAGIWKWQRSKIISVEWSSSQNILDMGAWDVAVSNTFYHGRSLMRKLS